LNAALDPPKPAALTTNPVCFVLAAHAATSVPVESLGELRRNLAPPGGSPLPANFLKHADEQSIAGLTAVFGAITAHGLAPDEFRDWGVVGAPSFLGRAAMNASLPRFLVEGAWEVSPHMIPHRSLHATSGSVSQALKIHGPNFGAGGGPGAEMEGLLAAVALLHSMSLPGVWLVSTWLDPELSADRTTGRPLPGTRSCGLALALLPVSGVSPGSGIANVQLIMGQESESAAALTRTALIELPAQFVQHSTVSYSIGSTGRLTLYRRSPVSQPAAVRTHGPHFGLRSPERSLTAR
jgi:hypothetical protein